MSESGSSPVKVPFDVLSPESLCAVIEDFVLREGTDYGSKEVSFETKVAALRKQLENGYAIITYEPDTETVSIVPTDTLPSL